MADENTAVAPGVAAPTQEELQNLWQEETARRSNPDAAPAAETPPAVETPPVEEPAAKTELPADLLAALAKVDELKDLVGTLQHQVRSGGGQIGALQRELQQVRAATQSVARAPNDQTVRAAQKSPEKWEQLKKDFPEWGEAVEELVAANRVEPAQVDLTPLQTEIQNQINGIVQQFHWAVEEAKLFGAHKDYKKVVNSPEFKQWWASQPGEIQALTASKAAEDAIYAIDLFQEARQKAADATRDTTQERSARLAAAAAPARKAATPPPSDGRDLTAAQLWAAEAARREEIRKSRI